MKNLSHASYGLFAFLLELIHEIHDSYFLLSVVDNDFVNGDIWQVGR